MMRSFVQYIAYKRYVALGFNVAVSSPNRDNDPAVVQPSLVYTNTAGLKTNKTILIHLDEILFLVSPARQPQKSIPEQYGATDDAGSQAAIISKARALPSARIKC
ncbi:hypothetical protein DAPPUDRAFT_251884 [Daphnia pulex]|uniref:Uncharacterized protein n=1 Tax=Daphnia pulex TaxID=6669 RepID=E9H1L1_DAPPU|nr:hypothetical protein DAPPUDRAFT_251884 [Daphnia pulex]|eukprot:EFX74486.1 hypothetical protein DAPPUDRAFT_251884 [Daphnia pulex]